MKTPEFHPKSSEIENLELQLEFIRHIALSSDSLYQTYHEEVLKLRKEILDILKTYNPRKLTPSQILFLQKEYIRTSKLKDTGNDQQLSNILKQITDARETYNPDVKVQSNIQFLELEYARLEDDLSIVEDEILDDDPEYNELYLKLHNLKKGKQKPNKPFKGFGKKQS